MPNGDQNRIISTSAPSVHNSTGLSTVLLGAVAGYRVFYHRSDETLAYLSFTNDDGWSSAGVVSQDSARSGFAIGSGYTDTDSITVVTPKDDKNIEVSALNDDTWHISAHHNTLLSDIVKLTDCSCLSTVPLGDEKHNKCDDDDVSYNR